MEFFSIAGIDPHKLLKTQVNKLQVKFSALKIENTQLKDIISKFDLKLTYLQEIINNKEKMIYKITKEKEILEEKQIELPVLFYVL